MSDAVSGCKVEYKEVYTDWLFRSGVYIIGLDTILTWPFSSIRFVHPTGAQKTIPMFGHFIMLYFSQSTGHRYYSEKDIYDTPL
jgi:hypothetical protein